MHFCFIATGLDSSEIRTGAASSFAPNPPAILHDVGEEISEVPTVPEEAMQLFSERYCSIGGVSTNMRIEEW